MFGLVALHISLQSLDLTRIRPNQLALGQVISVLCRGDFVLGILLLGVLGGGGCVGCFFLGGLGGAGLTAGGRVATGVLATGALWDVGLLGGGLEIEFLGRWLDGCEVGFG